MDRKEALKRTALLMGGTVFAPNILGVINGCTADPNVKWQPTYFSAKQAKIVSELAETILPRDEDPGAKDLGVPAFIEKMVADVYTDEEGKQFKEGLIAFNQKAISSFSNDFFNCSDEQRRELAESENNLTLTGQPKKTDALENRQTAQATNQELTSEMAAKRPFFLNFKELTILGYFTTKTVCTEVIKHDPVPGTYTGCIPYEDIGSVWAEN